APRQLLAAHLFDTLNRFQHRDAVLASSAEVVNFARPGTCRKFFDRAHHVVAVDVIAHLLAFVAKNRVRAAAQSDFHQIRQKSMELDAGMRRAGQASAAKDAYPHFEVPPIFLSDEVGGCLRRSKQRMQRAVDPAGLVNAVVIFKARIVERFSSSFSGISLGASPYTLLVLRNTKTASGECCRVASSKFTVPKAF